MATLPISPFQTLNEKYGIVKKAILERIPLSAIYDGHSRLLCPHVLGESAAGKLQALFYQFGGESSRGIEPDGSASNWRCLALDKLISVRAIDGRWHTAPNHSRPQTCVRVIHCEVTYY